MPAISLIIPLYNAVRHLRGCLNSVKAQTFTDFEVLLINDGQPTARSIWRRHVAAGTIVSA